jgi:capsular polysaccharide biosynthesis protein
MKKLFLKPPSLDDVLHLLAAWRIWIGAAIVGAAIASLIYFIAPPPYRAKATVVVDQNVEQAIPDEESDLRRYTYLQRETDKLIEIVWSDQTLEKVSSQMGFPVGQLRNGILKLSQPGDGAWHFLADAATPETAAQLASAWAEAFVEVMQSKPAVVSPLVEIDFTQQENLPTTRTVSTGVYIFCGSLVGVLLSAFVILFSNARTNKS